MIDDQFLLIDMIGTGGSSRVFLADSLFGTKFALKSIRNDKDFNIDAAKNILAREYELLQKLDHPNIVKSYYLNLDGTVAYGDQTEPVMYTLLEYAQHGSLSRYIRLTGGVEETIAKFFITQLCSAVWYLHKNDQAHLDIKLENILLDEYFNVKLADLGSSFNFRASRGQIGLKKGTYLYMAPEVQNLK